MSFSRLALIFALFFCGALAVPPCETGYHLYADGRCVKCSPGFRDAGYACQPCNAGTYQPEAGQAECLPCPPNTDSLDEATECISCPEGQALLLTNECGTCPPGKYLGFHSCDPCSSGFFKAGEGFGPCLPCPRNSHSLPAAAECIACPEGQTIMEDGSCAQCPAGTFYSSYDFRCEDCPTNTYTDSPNIMLGCFTCGGNSFSPPGSAECVDCPAGKVFIESSNSCESCEPGQRYDQNAQICDECSYNRFTVYENEPICRHCMHGTFSRPGSTMCFPCPWGQVYLAETDACGECPIGEYDSHAARCYSSNYYYYDTPMSEPVELPISSPEPFEGVFASPELFEEPNSIVSADPTWELPGEPEPWAMPSASPAPIENRVESEYEEELTFDFADEQ
ncbi:hypothetical protein FGB62_123g011 [Gracilaria domingensis]|nr:hypothetical protein FGB62_123g011 [Gracilaria domingensis]